MVPTTCHMDPFGHSWLLPPQFHGVETSSSVQFSRSVMSDSATPWIVAHQASLSITNSWSSLKLTSIESVMPSSHLILCRPLLLLPPIPPSIRVFSNESTLRMRWPKYWNFSFSIIPSKQIPGLISFRMDCLDLLSVHGTLKSLLISKETHCFSALQWGVTNFLLLKLYRSFCKSPKPLLWPQGPTWLYPYLPPKLHLLTIFLWLSTAF